MSKRISPHSIGLASAIRTAMRSLATFGRADRAIAAVEFAIILPIMLAIAVGSVEAARLLTFSQRVNLVANTAVQMLSQAPECYPASTPPVTPTCPTLPAKLSSVTVATVAYTDLHTAQDSAMVIFPQVLADAAQKGISWSSDIKISMASVWFVPTVSTCTTSCVYQAHVVWHSGPNPRPCGVNLSAVADNSTPSPTTLPQDLFPLATTSPQALYGGGSVLVVDIDYTYTPLFTSKLFGAIRMQRSAYVAPRYASLVWYDSTQSGDDGIGTPCSSF